MAKEIIRKNDGETVILEYIPKQFPIVATSSAEDFVSAQTEEKTDFKISELVADQVGISELQRKSIENRIEEMALDRLKKVEEKAYSEAYELGLIEGTQKAFDERKAEFEEQIVKMHDLLENFQSLKDRLMAENEATFMRMILEIATKLAMRNIEMHEESIVEVLRSLVHEIQSDDQITVKLSPEDLLFLESYKEKTGKNFELLDRMKLEASDGIVRGGCVVETNSGSIDATLRQRVSKAWELIESRLPRIKDNMVHHATDGNEGVQITDDDQSKKESGEE